MVRRYRSTLEVKPDINITPLMDVMCLLMILFMITSPILEYDVDVSPPKLTSIAIDENNRIMITLFRDGKMRCDRQDVERIEDLETVVRAKVGGDSQKRVLIRADGEKELNAVFEVMRAAKRAGAVSIGLVTQGETE